MRSVKNLLQDLVAGKDMSSQRAQNVKAYTPEPVQEPVRSEAVIAEERRKQAAERRTSAVMPVYIPKPDLPPPAPVMVAASDVCPDNNGKPHEVSISRGKHSCWVCGAELDPNKRDASTSWRAQVYGTRVKR